MSNQAMNDTADNTAVVLTPADAVRAAQERLETAIQATRRAHGVVESAQAKVRELEAEDTASTERHLKRFHEWIRVGGHSGNTPAPVADPALVQDCTVAKQTLRTAIASHELFEKEEVAARESLGAADRAWQTVQDARFTAEADRIVAQMKGKLREYVELYELIIELHNRSKSRRGGRTLLSSQAVALLNTPPQLPQLDSFSLGGSSICADINTPVGGRRISNPGAARKFWDEFAADGM